MIGFHHSFSVACHFTNSNSHWENGTAMRSSVAKKHLVPPIPTSCNRRTMLERLSQTQITAKTATHAFMFGRFWKHVRVRT